MGALAEALMAYAQPLIDATDGSMEELQKALNFSQIFWNLSLMPEKDRASAIDAMQSSLKLNDEEFDLFRRNMVDPMIARYRDMFGGTALSGGARRSHLMPVPSDELSMEMAPSRSSTATRLEKPKAGRNEPCPCGSGRKYKICCGR